MKTKLKIVVTPYQVEILREKKPKKPFKGAGKPPVAVAAPRTRFRWKAELVEAGQVKHEVGGFELPDEALGALVREMAHECETPDDVFEMVAGLFGDLSVRSADLTLGRSLRMAARHPHRRNAGCVVEIGEADPLEGGAA